MKEFRINNKGSGRLHSADWVENLTRTNFAVPVTFYYLVSLACLVVAALDESIVLRRYFWLFPLGMITFTLVEYLIHRYLFHFNAKTEKELELQYNIHGIHHEYPRDKERLVMPMMFSIILSSMFFFLFQLLFRGNGFIFFSGFIAGYSTYLMIHYCVHAMSPPKNFFRYLWKHHSLHHYASENSAFSVSFPLWDYLFGTMPTAEERKKVPGSL
jgi:sterol desaturase/sphingolipid hydroxylase (fatty acid hydroxylase superfamily)